MQVYCPKPFIQMAVVSILLMFVVSLDAQDVELPQPTMTLDPPLKVILPGEEFLLSCHFPVTLCTVEFYRNYTQKISFRNHVSHSASIKNEENVKSIGRNSYTCKYEKFFDNNKTWAYSPLSQPMELTVTDVIPKPTISLEPASGVVTVGGQVRINCTSSYPSHIAHLYKNNSRIAIFTKNVSDSGQTVSFTIEDLEALDSGEYSCGFEKTLKGIEYISSRSDTVQLNVTYDISKPTMHMEPSSGMVSVGGRVQITCNASSPSLTSHLYRKHVNKPIDTQNVSESDWSVTFTISDLIPNDAGEFSCSFMKMANGEIYETLRSDFVKIAVTDELPKPMVSVVPASGVVTVGESVQIKCSSSYPCHTSHLYKKYEKKPVDARNLSDSELSVTYNLTDLQLVETGEYSCKFVATVKGEDYESSLSDFMKINITDNLPKAIISVDPPSGVVNRGKMIRLTCSGSILNSGGWFYFYRDGKRKWSRTVPGSAQSTSFSIGGNTRVGTWKYSCKYARKVKKNTYYSPKSEQLQVTVRDGNGASNVCLSPSYLLGFVLSGSLIILLTE
ncbi:leukocyte immunoglobulin-like receptor subfamily A member 3 [Rhincodon typus]|uniref:leukocyte immunoglobulin-like receptor subfamily A member 3 n=1 Tax=Rhincodon typus TaxID=259920 RepID=UPI0009A3896F|nr:leukocyte immunoglobulin-like receptor subfamily A member 3 [Rhincodon typus]